MITYKYVKILPPKVDGKRYIPELRGVNPKSLVYFKELGDTAIVGIDDLMPAPIRPIPIKEEVRRCTDCKVALRGDEMVLCLKCQSKYDEMMDQK